MTKPRQPSRADLRKQFISELEDYAAHVWTESEVSAEELVDRMMRGYPVMTKQRSKLDATVRVLKQGNLFGEVPLDVPFAGCSHLDCIEGCNLGKGHCQRLELAFKESGYTHDQL